MDAQELPAVIGVKAAMVSEAPAVGCVAATCRWRCALEVIDELLRSDRETVRGEEADLLLDLRWQLRQRTEAETALRLFCDLRRRMERRHYLAFFRIRRWLENHVVAVARACPASEARDVPVKLNHYCVEAVRRACLCASLGHGVVMIAPRLGFVFRPVGNAAMPAAHRSR